MNIEEKTREGNRITVSNTRCFDDTFYRHQFSAKLLEC